MADQLRPPARLEREPAVLFRSLLDGVLVLGLRSDEPVRITTPGDAVWESLDAPRSLDSIAATLSVEFGAPVDVVRADIEPVVCALLRVGAIRAADSR